MTKPLLGLICAIALQADAPADLSYHRGTLWKVTYETQSRQYQYHIVDDQFRYFGASSKELRVTERSYVMFAIEGESLYLIDEAGERKTIIFLRKERLPPPPPPVH